jgi:hypothetical protein
VLVGDGGQVSVFRRGAPNWTHVANLTAPAPQASARFGWSVALDGRLGLIGAVSEDDVVTNDGVGYLFNLREDCNANERMDRCDIAGGTSFDADANRIPDECDADCNGNGQPDGLEADFDCDGIIDSCDNDSDNDGVPNTGDACATWPLGSRVNPSGGPLGDADNDCEITLTDYAAFVDCLNGPNAAPPVAQCLGVFDFDDQGDVDLFDYAEFTGRQ